MAKKAKKKKVWVLQAHVFSALRRSFRTYPPYNEVRNEAKEVYYIKSKKGKDLKRVRFKCNECGGKFATKNVAVDHIMPVSDTNGMKKQPNGNPDFNEYIDRLFCPKSNLQILCKKCHADKSKKEGKVRAKSRKTKQPKLRSAA